MGLVGLDKAEVSRRASLEALVSVEKNRDRRTVGGVEDVSRERSGLSLTRVRRREVKPVILRDVSTVRRGVSRALHDPNNLLDGVVKVHAVLVLRVAKVEGDRLYTSLLKLVDEVLVRLLREAAALLRV